jgi:hypothetical protein
VTALKAAAAGRGTRALQKLLRMLREYPRKPLLDAVRSAEQFGLYDLDRLERMILRQIADDYFPPPDANDELFDHHPDEGDRNE